MNKIFLFFFLLIYVSLSAVIHNIPGDFDLIQEGINAAATGDTILIHPGIYQENIDFIGKQITVSSLFHLTQDEIYIPLTVIQADSDEVAVNFSSLEDSLSILIGLTLTAGNGAVMCDAASPTLQHLIIHNNSSDGHGGGIYCEDANPIMQNLSINFNSSDGKGGGIYLLDSHPIMQNIILMNNSAQDEGGGIYLENSNSSADSLVLQNNSAVSGGGIYSENSNTIFSNIHLINNDSESDGGGICAVQESNTMLQNVFISGNASDDSGAGIYCHNSEMSISGGTFQYNGSIEKGGGVYLEDAEVEINDVLFYHNHSTEGGAIFLETAILILYNCIVEMNFADEIGGGIAAELNSFLQIDNCEFNLNEAEEKGGAIYLTDGGGVVDFSAITDNFTEGKGGGIYCENSPLVFFELIVNDNVSYSDGGGIYCDESDADFQNLTMIGNSSGRDGGAIACLNSDITIFNGLFQNNYADDDGTIYLGNDSQPILYNLTIVDNAVEDKGGAVYCSSGSPVLVNSIAANNTGSYGFYLVSGEPDISYCNFHNNEDGNFRGFDNNIGVITTVNVNNAPCDEFYNIQFNPQFDLSGEFPYALRDNSPSVNAGSPDISLIPDFDLIGNTRIYGQYVDMGAYENQNVLIVGVEESSIASAVINFSNYPNPFNPSTEIRLQISDFRQIENAEITIYNLKGQKIKTLPVILSDAEHCIEGCGMPLRYSAVWNGKDDNNQPVSSGIYFYHLNIKNSPTGKMILLK